MMRNLLPLLMLGLGVVAANAQPAARATVAYITSPEGPHLSEYLAALAETVEVAEVLVVGCPAATAQTSLGAKYAGTFATAAELYATRKPDVVLVALEPRLAAPAIVEAIDAGCHVIAEKPAFLDVGALTELTRRADAQGLLFMLALGNRTNPESQLARELIREHKLGKIRGVEMHLVADQTRLRSAAYQRSWFAQKSRSGGGHLTWLGVHWVDLAMYLTGSDIVEIAGFVANVGGQPIDVEDSAVLTLKFGDGFLGTMTSGYYLEQGYHSHLKIWGETGWIELNLHGGESPMRYYSSTDADAGIKVFRRPEKNGAAYTPFLSAAVRAALGQGEPPISNRESLRIVATIRAAYAAAASGTVTRISQPGE